MFTSRAEYRLTLREDNADLRLTPIARELGLVDEMRWKAFEAKREAVEAETARLRSIRVRPETLDAARAGQVLGGPLARETRALDLLARPEVDYAGLMRLPGLGPGVKDPKVAEQVGIQVKYAGYIERQQAEIDRQRRNEAVALPEDLDYTNVRGLSSEVREKFLRHRPGTLGQAARIPGVTPAAISLLLIHLRKKTA